MIVTAPGVGPAGTVGAVLGDNVVEVATLEATSEVDGDVEVADVSVVAVEVPLPASREEHATVPVISISTER